ncbi:hypothetical protein BJX68DRAFT_267313 [Aspergillus pseudodeflectus]|uniref:Uncharacterized protein n=1 Tax=Aspergillus pseudodeflectus TaxID=176178 RepID=A0ABR4K9J2_9EURO
MISKLVTRCQTEFIQSRLRAFGDIRSDQEQFLCQRAMEYTEENSHEKACKIWLELLQKCPYRYHFQKGFSDAARPLSARRRLQLLDEAFPDNNLDHDWVECQKAIAYTENGLHDEACKTWIALLQQEKERLVFKEGFLKAIQPLPTDQRLKLLQLVKNDEAVLWVDHAIAMEYYSRKDYEKAYQSFSLLCMSQAIEVLRDAIMPLIHSIDQKYKKGVNYWVIEQLITL